MTFHLGLILYGSLASIFIFPIIVIFILNREIYYKVFRIPYRIIWVHKNRFLRRHIVKDSNIKKSLVKLGDKLFLLDDEKMYINATKPTYFVDANSPLAQQLMTISDIQHDKYTSTSFKTMFQSKALIDAFRKQIEPRDLVMLIMVGIALVGIIYVATMIGQQNELLKQIMELITKSKVAPPPPSP